MVKKEIFGFIVCVLIASSAFATPTVQLWRQSGYYSGSGGEFTAKPSASGWSWDPLDYYDDSTKNIGDYDPSFQTFCVETSEFLSPNGETYDVVINDSAVLGGVGSADPLSQGTAWLYKEFAAGTLSGYDYTLIASRSDSARDLQKAIWYLEEEAGGSLNAYTTLVAGEFSNLATAKLNNADYGQYPVKVMTLWTEGHAGVLDYCKQDLLVMSSPTTSVVPAPGAVLLAGIGVGLVGWLRRQRSL